jgi:O-antigen/teichoic acid export membrane protein
MFLSFLLLPTSLKYFDENKFGIWLTLVSIIGWISFLDLGVTNTIRNKLGRSLAIKDFNAAKKDISNAFLMLAIIFLFSCLFFEILIYCVNWDDILNTGAYFNNEIVISLTILNISLFLNSVFGVVFTVISSDQDSITQEVQKFISIFISFLGIFFFNRYFFNSLIFNSVVITFISAALTISFYIYFFYKKYNQIRPDIKLFDLKLIYKLFGTSSSFFIIQISALVLFMTDNIVISKIFSPAEVVPYNISFRLFNIVVTLFGILTAPSAAALNNAHNLDDQNWIKNYFNKIFKIWAITVLFIMLLFLFSNQIYLIWVGKAIIVDKIISFSMAIFVLVQTYNVIYVSYLFSIGKIKVQLIAAILAALINIPLSVVLCKYFNTGPSGVIIATILCSFPNVFLSKYQSNLILNNKAKGIWAK